MSTRLFAGGVMIMATIGAIGGGFNLGQLTQKSFDFASATEESRQAFLKALFGLDVAVSCLL